MIQSNDKSEIVTKHTQVRKVVRISHDLSTYFIQS